MKGIPVDIKALWEVDQRAQQRVYEKIVMPWLYFYLFIGGDREFTNNLFLLLINVHKGYNCSLLS